MLPLQYPIIDTILKNCQMINGFFSILPLTVCLVWFSIFAARYRKNNSAQRLLVLFFFLCSILYASHYVYFNRHISLFARMESVYAFCTLAGYPLYYLYILNLTEERPCKWSKFLVLLPSAAIALAAMFFYILMDEKTRCCFVVNEFYTHGKYDYDLPWMVQAQIYRVYAMKVMYALQIVPVCYFGYRRLRHFDQLIHNFYADTEKKELGHVRILLVVFLIFACISITANFLGREFFINEWWKVCIPSVLFSGLLFSVGLVGYRQQFTAYDYYRELRASDEREKKMEQCTKAELTDHTKALLRTQINELMEEREVFRQKNLSLSDFVEYLGINRSYVSNFINNEIGLSFSDFINQYRVSHAQILMKDTETERSMQEIWEQSGFSSESSFYRVFRKMTGGTPLAWKRKCRKTCRTV